MRTLSLCQGLQGAFSAVQAGEQAGHCGAASPLEGVLAIGPQMWRAAPVPAGLGSGELWLSAGSLPGVCPGHRHFSRVRWGLQLGFAERRAASLLCVVIQEAS